MGDDANKAWQANVNSMKGLVTTAAKLYTTPLGALAIGTILTLATPKLGEDVYYAIVNQANRDLFLIKQPYHIFDEGKGVGGFKRFTDANLCQGTFFICLMNDNTFQGIDAQIKVSAIVETNTYEDKTYTDQVITPKYEKQIMKEPVISVKRFPVAG